MKITPLSKSRRLWNHVVCYCKSLLTERVPVSIQGRSHTFNIAQMTQQTCEIEQPKYSFLRKLFRRKAINAYLATKRYDVVGRRLWWQ